MTDTDKKYNDAEGHPRDIHEMIILEPEWVGGRFLSIERELKAYKQGAARDSKIIHEREAEIRRLRSALTDIKNAGSFAVCIEIADAMLAEDKEHSDE